MKRSKGFSLVELLIVIVIIGVIAAIAIPNLLAARRAANEGSCVSSHRTLHGANVSYAATLGSGDYAGDADSVGTTSLQDLAAASLIDPVLGIGEKSGYVFVGNRSEPAADEPETFYFAANPVTATGTLMSGTKRFGVATEGVIRFDANPVDLATPFDETTLPSATPVDN